MTNNYQVILFDLDGTLTDSRIGVAKSIQYALAKSGIEEPSLEKLEQFIGPPLLDTFTKHFGFDDEKARQALQHYRERYVPKGMFEETYVYPGIIELLANLSAHGKKCLVVTSKPAVLSRQILEHFDLLRFFNDVVGPDLNMANADKTSLILRVLAQIKPLSPQSFVMIGDRAYDIIGAKNAGIDSIAVLYGHGSEAELSDAHPTFIAKDVSELEGIILS